MIDIQPITPNREIRPTAVGEIRFYQNWKGLRDLDTKTRLGFLFHDFDNLVTAGGGWAVMYGKTGGYCSEEVEKAHTRLLEKTNGTVIRKETRTIERLGKKIVEEVESLDKDRGRDINDLYEYAKLMNVLADYSKSQKIQDEFQSASVPEVVKREIGYLPTAAKLTECYLDTLHYLEYPNKTDLEHLKSKRFVASDILKKTPFEISPALNIEVDGVEGIMLYAAAIKFLNFKGDPKVSLTENANGRQIIFEADLQEKDELDRFERYRDHGFGVERSVPTADTFNKTYQFSAGLYMGELMGYATGRDYLFSTEGGKARFTIRSPYTDFTKKV